MNFLKGKKYGMIIRLKSKSNINFRLNKDIYETEYIQNINNSFKPLIIKSKLDYNKTTIDKDISCIKYKIRIDKAKRLDKQKNDRLNLDYSI